MIGSDPRMAARLVRRSGRRLAQRMRYRRASLSGVPILFANSFPKSGTHLLTQILQGMTRLGPVVDSGLPAVVTFEGDSGRPRPPAEILGDLRRLLPGDIAYGHLHAMPEVVDFLCRPGYALYFILRDPRDVVVSHVHYVTEMAPEHIHHTYYQSLDGFAERLRTSILGRPEFANEFPDIRRRFDPYTSWLDRPEVLTLRFEDLIRDRRSALSSILEHAQRRGFPLQIDHQSALHLLEGSIDPQRSPTFRSGRIGGWQAQFDEENKRLFKKVSGDLLIRLGYESDDDW